MDFTIVLNAMLVLLALMLVGFILYKLKLMTDEESKFLSKLVINVTNPALIIYSVLSDTEERDIKKLGNIVLILILSFLFLFIISKLIVTIFRLKGIKNKTYQAMLSFANIGFMGIPLLSSIYGNKVMIYISIAIVLFNLFIFSYGIFLLNPIKSKFKIKNLINTNIIAAIIALLIYIFDIRIPNVLSDILKHTSNVTTFAAMVVIGATIASQPLKEIFLDYKVYIFSFIKLILLPILMWLVFKNIVTDKLLFSVLIIITGMPIASTVTMLANEYNGDVEDVSKGTCITTILSVVTIPLIAYLFL